MFQTLNLACDNSTLANFKAWAQAVSSWLSTAGWVKSSDTGQVNWSTISSVPGANAFVYEVWEPNDGLTNFFFKLEYGNSSGANSPTMRLSIGTATNGAGGLSGDVIGPYIIEAGTSQPTPPAANLYPCYFSGQAGRVSILMWRGAGFYSQAFAVERSINSSGTYTGSHVTLMTAGLTNSNVHCPYIQQTLLFGVGVAPAQSDAQSNQDGMAVRVFRPGNTTISSDFNGAVPFDTVAPMIGYFDLPLTSMGFGNWENYTEGQIFTTTLYGASRSYVATGTSPLNLCGPGGAQGYLCVRYD